MLVLILHAWRHEKRMHVLSITCCPQRTLPPLPLTTFRLFTRDFIAWTLLLKADKSHSLALRFSTFRPYS